MPASAVMSGTGLDVETDVILTLITDDDWLQDRAEAISQDRDGDLWTARDTVVEIMLVAYREGWNVGRAVADTNALLAVRGDTDSFLATARHLQEHGVTPFDALHLVNTGGVPIVSSDDSYDGFAERVPLESAA